ncbi:MAG: folylpolyglutamate synthase/dihydrofolate synthase family protein [Terriglobales bacterium]
MSYETAVAQMYALGYELTQTPSHKFDLEHMRVLLAALGNPERTFPSVLIAGTNGKGSTAATLASILQASGLRTGLYTSPHLVRINERIRLDGQAIGDNDFALIHDVVGRTAERLVGEGDLPWHPSFFEMLTAMAFEYFARNRPEIVVLEVGMGGRLDATNVVEPRMSIITDIALDHQKFLGETIAEIAREKAGIIRQSGVVVTLPQLPQANDVIGHAILDAGARAVNAVPYVPSQSPVSSTQLPVSSQFSPSAGLRQRYLLELLGTTIKVESPLIGRHQFRNIALAIAAAVELNEQGFRQITPAAIERGIHQTQWPGRFQIFTGAISEDPAGVASGAQPSQKETRPPVEYVFDVAHNPAGAWALRATLSAVYGDRPVTMVFGVLRDKAMAEMAEILFPIAERVIATHADNPRAASPAEIRQAAARVAGEVGEAENVREALEQAEKAAGSNGLVVVTGSIYLVGEAMRMLGARI